MQCKKCKSDIDSDDFWGIRWKLCDGCQAAAEDNADYEREERAIKRLENKWNCEHCIAMFERGGCPDHGPCLT